MKFAEGLPVRKKKGYKFVGVIKSGYKVDEGIRYDVQVDKNLAIKRLHELMRQGLITIPRVHTLMEIEEMLSNCHGMIHIFSEEQLEKHESNLA